MFDTGAFIAIERGNRELVSLLKREQLAGRSPRTHGGVVAQVWRGGTGKQKFLAQLLRGFEVRALDDSFGRRVGRLLAESKTSDVIDAAVILLANDGDEVITSDANDLLPLARAAGKHIDLIEV